jgi:hypothetical protein
MVKAHLFFKVGHFPWKVCGKSEGPKFGLFTSSNKCQLSEAFEVSPRGPSER